MFTGGRGGFKGGGFMTLMVSFFSIVVDSVDSTFCGGKTFAVDSFNSILSREGATKSDFLGDIGFYSAFRTAVLTLGCEEGSS